MLLHLKPTPSWIKSYHCFQYLMWGRKGYTGGDNETSWKETIQGLVMASCPANGLLVGSTDDKSTLPQSQQLGVSTAAVIYIAMVIRQYFRRYIANPHNTRLEGHIPPCKRDAQIYCGVQHIFQLAERANLAR